MASFSGKVVVLTPALLVLFHLLLPALRSFLGAFVTAESSKPRAGEGTTPMEGGSAGGPGLPVRASSSAGVHSLVPGIRTLKGEAAGLYSGVFRRWWRSSRGDARGGGG